MSKYDTKIMEFLGPVPADVGEAMDFNNPADLLRAERYAKDFCSDPRIIALAAAGDNLSKSQTKHDLQHLIAVRNIGMQMLDEYDRRFPGKLTEWEKRVEAPLSLLLHDIGRAIDVDNHAAAGARIAYIYLSQRRFPRPLIQRVCRNVALHRSDEVLKREFNNIIWAFTVLADKCVGDEDRVRPLEANILRVLCLLRLAHINWWDEAAHDRVNFAITNATVIVDSHDARGLDAGAIVLKLTMRDGITSAEEITTLYGKRFHACGRAAQYLGFSFRIEFNGVRYMYDKEAKGWCPIVSISVPMP